MRPSQRFFDKVTQTKDVGAAILFMVSNGILYGVGSLIYLKDRNIGDIIRAAGHSGVQQEWSRVKRSLKSLTKLTPS